MKPIIKWLCSWFLTSRVVREVASLEYRCERYKKDSELARLMMQKQAQRYDRIQTELENEAVRTKNLLEKAEKLNGKLQVALEGVQERLKIAEEIVIPGLMKVNETLNAARDYQTAQFTMKQALIESQGRDNHDNRLE